MSTSNGYPFMSRKQIQARIAAEPAFAVECVGILQRRHEQRAAGAGESMGWMASHVARATALATRLASGETTGKDRTEAAELARRYSKQLARVFRERDLAARPELGVQAAVFGIGGAGEGQPMAAPPVASTPDAGVEQPAAPKKRGRPQGSKNRPKDQPSPRRRRRA